MVVDFSLTEAVLPRRSAIKLLLRACEHLLHNSLFNGFMTVLTIYVLIADDMRLWGFTKAADETFNGLTVASLVIFTFEIVICSLVTEDYFLGFWFIADLLASASLCFDLTSVSEAMIDYQEITASHHPSSQDANHLKASRYAGATRSSSVGTRVARLLRVARLVRINRVLRCIQWSLASMPGAALVPGAVSRRVGIAPGSTADIGEQAQAESRVGKKLSERTMQRVIMLVLAMLMVVPQLNAGDSWTMVSTSAQYGADVILQAWLDFEFAVASNMSAGVLFQQRQDWENQTLLYIYYHNWWTVCPAGATNDCAADLMNKLCWVGYVKAYGMGDNLDASQEGYIKALADRSTDWDSAFGGSGTDARYLVGSLPQDIKATLTKRWTTDCSGSSRIIGTSLLRGMPCPRLELRKQETTWYTPVVHEKSFFEEHAEWQFVFVYDIRKYVQWEAALGIVQTVFIVMVLAIGAFLFSRDVENLVLQPIERMINKVEKIRQDPLYAIRLGHLQYKEDSHSRGRQRRITGQAAPRKGRAKPKYRRQPSLKKANTTMETMILENAIIKLGSLLALGFGEAGSEIIGQNLDDDNATVNAMIPGSKVEAIYGFCAIRNFATATEVLQEKTMVFVNQVAEIVHRIVDAHLGAANKNVGEAFLLVWRVGQYNQELRPKVAGLAVLSFVQVVAELSRDTQLAEYREHPALLARLPKFRVSLGFGLHLGWSIEGAIGSEFKIDASYLSPHVNVAVRLEAATAEYGVTILLSEPLVRSCEMPLSRHFRAVDHVRLQGSTAAMRLFSVDLDYEILPVETAMRSRQRKGMANRYRERQQREQEKSDLLLESFKVHQVFDTDRYVRRMREPFLVDFFREFEKGYLNYEAGEWDVAAKVLLKTKAMLPGQHRVEDGPSATLLDYMRGYNFEAPGGWPGWRELRER